MNFDYWVMGITAIFWLVSMVVYGRVSFQTGVISAMQHLADQGYIKVTEDEHIIGLCNQDHLNHRRGD